METKLSKMTVAAIMILFAWASSNAQDVDGISIWDKYTKDQLIQKYGQTIFYDASEGDSKEEGLYESIRFKDVWFFLTNNHIAEFSIESNTAKALTKTIKGGIKLGDDASVLAPIKGYINSEVKQKNGETEFVYCLKPDVESYFYVNVKDNKIVKIWTYSQRL